MRSELLREMDLKIRGAMRPASDDGAGVGPTTTAAAAAPPLPPTTTPTLTPTPTPSPPNFVDELVARMRGGDDGPLEDAKLHVEGNEQGAPTKRAAAVSPALQHATARLLNPGPPPLRQGNERIAGSLSLHMLQEHWTLSAWVTAQQLTAHNERECRTIARAVERGVADYGAGFLESTCSEVLMRRLVVVVLAAKSGSWRPASLLEEVPKESMCSVLPYAITKSLKEQLNTETAIEAMLQKDAARM